MDVLGGAGARAVSDQAWGHLEVACLGPPALGGPPQLVDIWALPHEHHSIVHLNSVVVEPVLSPSAS